MYKKDVIDHFGTQRAVAKALGISDAAVSQWKEVIPEKDAYRLEIVTAGALKYQESAYRQAAYRMTRCIASRKMKIAGQPNAFRNGWKWAF